jgi:ribonuclease T2
MSDRGRWQSATAAAMLMASPALAQSPQCVIPDQLESPREEPPPPGEVVQARPTHYLLSLSWSPQFCRGKESDPRHENQCAPLAGVEGYRFGFILHGLWPDAPGRADPAWCKPVKPISRALVRQHFCMTPSPQLLQHEWAKHGSCSSDAPEKYFRAASLLFAAIRMPDMERLSRGKQNVGTFKSQFARANPGLPMASLSVRTSGPWLSEVRICLGLDLKPMPCRPEDRGARNQVPLQIWVQSL